VIAVFVGSVFWLWEPLITTYAGQLRPKWKWFFRITVWTLGLNIGIGCGFAALTMGVFPWDRYWSLMWDAFLPGIIINTICFTAFTIHEGVKYQLCYELAQARLESLEARLRPHFLFNALNSVVALIPEDPALAEQVTVKLADLLRYSLDAERRSTVPLEQELKVTTDYLEIEKTRFGERLRYSIDVPSEVLRAQVPPFSLQTLVENSVKYGGGEIRVRAQNGNGKLVLTVWDSGSEFGGKQKETPGHGLHDLRKRLTALWGSDAALEYPQDAGGAAVAVSVPYKV
jgi:LytS/YehU family sensor histidine kinase